SVNNLPVGIYTQTAGSTTISVDATKASSLSKLLLTDNGTSPATVTDLLVSNYTFTAAAGTSNTRFAITAQRIATDNNLIGIENSEVGISIVNGGLVLANVANNASVRVFDALGRMVVSKTATSNMMEIKLNARGIYTVQLQSGSSISTRKVIF
ncbi:MAG: T9SS type A sorting domain-containing protein, partial [Paludibacter sp.]